MPKLKNIIFEFLLITFSILAFVYLYGFTLRYYFQQDDFFFLLISKATSLKDIPNFFVVREGLIAYRPFSERIYYYVIQTLFGLNPVIFRIVNFLLILTSFFLIIKVVAYITKDRLTGILTACFWITASFHFMAISWIAASYNIVGTFFYLLTSLCFLKHIDTKKRIYYFFSITFFIFTIGSFEFSITWPAVFALYYIYILKKSYVETIMKFLPFIIISISYLFVKLLFTNVPQIPEYAVAFNVNSLKAFFWYVLWAFNIPEEFKYQVSNLLILMNNKFLFEFWPLVFKSSTLMIWTCLLVPGIPIYRSFKKEINLNRKIIIFSIIYFVITIAPVLLLPNHTYTMYLTLSSIGVYTLMAHLLSYNKSKLLILSVLALWILSSQVTLNFYKNTSWIVGSQKTAKDVLEYSLSKYPTLPKGTTLYFPLTRRSEEQALSGKNAFKVIYDDAKLEVYYSLPDLREAYKKGKIKNELFIISR